MQCQRNLVTANCSEGDRIFSGTNCFDLISTPCLRWETHPSLIGMARRIRRRSALPATCRAYGEVAVAMAAVAVVAGGAAKQDRATTTTIATLLMFATTVDSAKKIPSSIEANGAWRHLGGPGACT